ncbi:SCP-like extracellular protein [Phytophthora cinnamomi]|uniref:SCP-like extracellular protein n=1 Tax=Phytophthora cinnamomi TaxID=4785 RepID=UPI0035599708|nr:SCP-like extracellular protein [Phytophthora cinnamomi]
MTDNTEFAAALLARVNKERASHGLPALCSNKKLTAAAERHVKDQSTTDFMSDNGTDNSTPVQRAAAAGFKCTDVKENIDEGSPDVETVFNNWMKGEGRQNILGNFKMVGSAYAYSQNTFNKHHWVQVFAVGATESCDL